MGLPDFRGQQCHMQNGGWTLATDYGEVREVVVRLTKPATA